MTAHTTDGGPAFPVHDLQAAQPSSMNDLNAMARGMSLREADAEIERLRARVAELERALHEAEAALADIGDADREPGDDVAWCEQRAAKSLPVVRAARTHHRGNHPMKMAKADARDLRAANAVAGILEDIGKGYYPRRVVETPDGIDFVQDSDDDHPTFFDPDDEDHRAALIESLLLCEKSGSLFRVTFGMQVLLDPRNEIVDPDADTLEAHPRFKLAMEEREAFKASSDIRGAELERLRARVAELEQDRMHAGVDICEVAAAVEVVRAVEIVKEVAGVVANLHEGPFRHGFEAACEEIEHRLRPCEHCDAALSKDAAP